MRPVIQLRPHQEHACNMMTKYSKGQVLMPTGAGKTITMIADAIKEFKKEEFQTIAVVSPRIMLTEQLSSEFLEYISNAHVMHCHTGETQYFKSTRPDIIRTWTEGVEGHKLIFTTYNSLKKIQDSGITVDTIYFDEAHNSVKSNFFPHVEYFSHFSNRCYFYTATRKTSTTLIKPGMNDYDVYGDIIFRVSAPKLIQSGYIVKPQLKVKKFDVINNKLITCQTDSEHLISTINDFNCNKILVCVKSSKQLINLMSETDFYNECQSRGYSCLYITSKTGAFIDGVKVTREEFFETLKQWDKSPNKKFVCLHRSILSEGISINSLDSVIFLRNMNVIELTQTVGRTLRTAPDKEFGLCVVPTYSKTGVSTQKSLQNVIDVVFKNGESLDSVVKK